MNYTYNLYNKLVFRKHKKFNVSFKIMDKHKIGFRNRINRLTHSSRVSLKTTTKRFNY